MKKEDIEKSGYYMHVHTGIVDLGSDWLFDFEEQGLNWEDWEGGVLCEVEKDAGGYWIAKL